MIFFIVDKTLLAAQRILKSQHQSGENVKVGEQSDLKEKSKGEVPQSSDIPFLSVLKYSPEKPPVAPTRSLVAWNEVFDSLGDLYQAIVTISHQDPLCQWMLAQARTLYGITLPAGLSPSLTGDEVSSGPSISTSVSNEDLIDSKEMQEIVDDIFVCWAHPWIGNIGHSPSSRPLPHITQASSSKVETLSISSNWKNDSIDDTTQRMIAALSTRYPFDTLHRSSRDQARICWNTTELARAIIGEITCNVSKRLEKLLALQLCRSDSLLLTLRTMLLNYRKSQMPDLGALKVLLASASTKEISLANFEYCSYYLKESTPVGIKGENLALVLHCLLESAIKDDFHWESSGMDHWPLIVEVWKQLPKLIRCVILMNDLKRVDMTKFASSFKFGGLDPVSFGIRGIAALAAQPDPFNMSQSYTLVPAAEKSFVPTFGQKGWAMVYSWNRDEFHDATVTYRGFLCPLWAGPSGHSRENSYFWQERVPQEDVKRESALAIACGLFVLWRLYYDKRISGVHTLVETLEATCITPISNVEPYPEKCFAFHGDDDLSHVTDAYEVVKHYRIQNRESPNLSVDPIALLQGLRKVYMEGKKGAAYKRLKDMLDQEREKLTTAGFFVPQWSHELTAATGTNVKKFARSAAKDDIITTTVSLAPIVPGDATSQGNLTPQGESK